ncbi:hypothetical protein L9F63_012263 [Diploptera punctata]|uniref:Uncharacterized protein n=1 Tax=Diploptera punctata TaxID=6984 RepID=A0AAD8ACX7_DIPPU|nr:hypothetical protein L9F63_012263 [Diploptera punctata]
MDQENATRKLTLLRLDGGRRRGRPKLRWMDGIEERLRKSGTGMEKEGVGQRCIEECPNSSQGP